MKRRLVAAGLLAATPLLAAAQPPGFEYWSAAELQGYAAALAPRVDARNIAIADRILDRDGYFAAMVHREAGEGTAESHADWVDIYMVTSGSGTLIVGGTIPDGAATSPGEYRGSKIEGGTRQRLGAGDIVQIPPARRTTCSSNRANRSPISF